jgi:RNA polymerase sigma factor (sigma-70 family)
MGHKQNALKSNDSRFKAPLRAKRASLRKDQKKKSAQVVLFPLDRIANRQPKLLSPAKRQELVLDSRDSARKVAKSILRKWRCKLDLAEVESIVDLSLCEASARFDSSRGVSFLTFMFYHLRGNLVRFIDEVSNTNTISLSEHESFDFNSDNGSTHNQLLDSQEIAAALNSQEQPLPDDIMYRNQVSEFSQAACEKLDHLEQQVIARVFVNEENMEDLASSLGYSRCHLSRIKRKALDSLKRDLGPVISEAKVAPQVSLRATKKAVTRRGEHRRKIIKTIYQKRACG